MPGVLRQNRGFTLLEVLIAITISALVLTVVYQTFNGIVDSAARLEEVSDMDQMARISLGIISRELRSAYWKEKNSGDLTFSGVDGLDGGEASDKLVFTTFSPWIGKDGTVSPNLSVISYDLEAAGEEEEFYLMHLEDPNPLSQSLSSRQRYELAEQVKGFNLRYFDEEAGEWKDEWDAGIEKKLPNAVEIQLYFKTSAGGEQMYSTSTEIPMSFQ
ncbi:MAG TPA: prepilin-type N-terminal cleavage/methylation domain-containing protein [Nitrospiria bacterium]|nr:prepilin-type N-terminal cleavage/methylation domain-containing protein [Nitrospiria bacterium]